MIDFHPVTLADKALVEHYTLRSDCRNCDLSFGNIFCWRHSYRPALAVVEGFLVIRFSIDGGHRIGYMKPLGTGDFLTILPHLAADAHRHGQRLRLIGLDRAECDRLREQTGGAFACDDDRSLADYLYEAEELRTLRGSKFQPKRNHVNKFSSLYNYRYAPLTSACFADCLRLEAEWRSAHAGQGHTSEMTAEQRAMQEAFDHFEALGMVGGCLYVDERLVAFTYGSPLSRETFDCHVEKADTRYEGVFAAINRLFAEQVPASFRYINREEDMGLEGLRRSKCSYHPAALCEKFTAIRLRDDEREVKQLWQTVFGDEEAFVDRFLIRYAARERLVARRDAGGALCAMLHLLPFRSELGRTAYIYAVATAPEHRRQGLATQLLREALDRARRAGYAAAVLIPAEAWLRDYYGRFGFSGSLPVTFDTAAEFDFGTGDAAQDRAMVCRLDNEKGQPVCDRLHLLFEP